MRAVLDWAGFLLGLVLIAGAGGYLGAWAVLAAAGL